ncbi:MAG TPA: methyltransferase domain-containing protein [Candidatus Baltobacteraceae bacterium]|nr:methyltransferase domain-containing protein [Candidatus Baltobacteraceae bacterium]
MTDSRDRYTARDHAFRERDPYAAAKYWLTLRWLRPRMRPGELLYNVGVGSGWFNHLAVAHGLRVEGCEPDADAFTAAQRSAPRGCTLEHGGLESFARGRPPAPLLVMHDVLEHIEDDRRAAATVSDLVAPGGVAVISVPALMCLFGRHDEELGHFRRYTPSSLRAVMEPYFTFERLRWFGAASIPIAWYFSRFRRAPYPTGAVGSPLGRAYAAVCAAESFIPEPIGTSLIALLRPRAPATKTSFRL